MPSSILNSDDGVISGTSGIKAVGGDDGVLVFQSKGTETARINTDKQIVAAAGTASLPIYSTTGDVNTGIYFPAADNIGFATNGVIRGRWTTDGLCFGTDTAAANALDDYEEGTWTPSLQGLGGTPSYSQQLGIYTKIGNVVCATAYVTLTVTSSGSAQVYLQGFPFTTANDGVATTGSIFPVQGFGGTWTMFCTDMQPNGTRCDLYKVVQGTGNNYSELLGSNVGSSFNFRCTIIYRV